MNGRVYVSVGILIFTSQIIFYECHAQTHDDNYRSKRQTSSYDSFAKQFQSCRNKTLNEFDWMLETYKEVSGLEKQNQCGNLCWSDQSGCKLFLALPHGSCYLRKYSFNFDAVMTPIELKESVKFIFESKSNTTFKNPRAVNVTSKALCGALCFIMENCTYSQMYQETCVTFQYNQTSDKMDILKIPAIPDAKDLPSAFGYQVGHNSWVVCSANYCFLGDRKPHEKTSMSEFKKFSVRQRKLFKPWTNWTNYISNPTDTIVMTSIGNNSSQESSKWSDWSDWSSCKISCSGSSSQNRSRKCQSESNEGTKTCELGQLQSETANCDKTLNDSALSIFNENSRQDSLVWRKQVYREISESLHHCSSHCLMESSKCNIFISYNSGKCLLAKFDSNNSFSKVDLIESIQYLFGAKLNLSLETMRFENVSREKVCIALCLMMDNCMSSSIVDQSCDVKIGDYNVTLGQGNSKQDKDLKYPKTFGLKLSTHIWILCQDFYCFRGVNTLVSNSSNTDSQNREMLEKERDGLLFSKDDKVEIVNKNKGYANDSVIMATSPINQLVGQWSRWGEWSNTACTNDCGDGQRSRTRSCRVPTGGKTCDGISTDFNSKCKDAFPPCFVSCVLFEDYTYRHMSVSNVFECHKICKEDIRCTSFSYSIVRHWCYLKGTFNRKFLPNTDYISGGKC